MRRINTDLRFSFRQWQSLGQSGLSDTRLRMSASDRKPECYQPTSVRGGVRLSGRLYAMRRIDRVLVQRRAGDALGLCLSPLPACSTPAATEVAARVTVVIRTRWDMARRPVVSMSPTG